MSSISHNGDSISYTYDPDGIRTSKTVNGTTTKYHVMNGTLLGQTKGSDTIVFLYDEKANRYGFDYNGTKYYYIFNVQGDVIGILNQAGQKIVSYTYDPWGKVLSVDGSEASTIGQLNPIRYRGYYYDTETGFYYLQSRYYDPITRRFLNADGMIGANQDILSYNLFAYCSNDPVNYCDPTGCYLTPYDRLRVLLASGKAWYDAQGKLHVSYSSYRVKKKSSRSMSDKGVTFVADYETLVPSPEDDGYGNLTVGYGHVVQPNEKFGTLTKPEALALLASDLKVSEDMVNGYSRELGVVWDQNQFDAFVSLAYNSGYYFEGVMDQIVDGVDPHTAFGTIIYAGSEKSLGLYRRRMDEADMFVYGTYRRTYRDW
ncbi:MAG: RHS repeat-associated core domain-containing protein [[Clostridium] leptum]